MNLFRAMAFCLRLHFGCANVDLMELRQLNNDDSIMLQSKLFDAIEKEKEKVDQFDGEMEEATTKKMRLRRALAFAPNASEVAGIEQPLGKAIASLGSKVDEGFDLHESAVRLAQTNNVLSHWQSKSEATLGFTLEDLDVMATDLEDSLQGGVEVFFNQILFTLSAHDNYSILMSGGEVSEDVDKLMVRFDSDGDEMLDYIEFSLLMTLHHLAFEPADILNFFKEMDSDDDDLLSLTEMGAPSAKIALHQSNSTSVVTCHFALFGTDEFSVHRRHQFELMMWQGYAIHSECQKKVGNGWTCWHLYWHLQHTTSQCLFHGRGDYTSVLHSTMDKIDKCLRSTQHDIWHGSAFGYLWHYAPGVNIHNAFFPSCHKSFHTTSLWETMLTGVAVAAAGPLIPIIASTVGAIALAAVSLAQFAVALGVTMAQSALSCKILRNKAVSFMQDELCNHAAKTPKDEMKCRLLQEAKKLQQGFHDFVESNLPDDTPDFVRFMTSC